MGLSASQGRLLLLTAKKSDLEFRAQQIAMLRSILCQQQEAASKEYENATSNRIMDITLIAATGADVGSARSTDNLTYQNLISGTVTSDIPEEISGIISSEKAHTDYYPYTSAQFYRLTTPDGAIVVSDASEIPMERVSSSSKTIASRTPTKLNGDTGGIVHYIETKDAENKVINTTYGIIAPEGSALKELLGNGEPSKSGFTYAELDGQVWVKYGNDYYNVATGAKGSNEDLPQGIEFKDDSKAVLYASADKVPPSTQETSQTYARELSEAGPDGVQTLYEIRDGVKVPLQRYLIDPNLTKGFIDAEGGFNDINYLQDCLRNGRYMLQRCIVDKEDPYTPYRWTDLSWDAAANITDSYYTDDDAAAKAKYDRIQSEIQAQDKKLELELDDIETQRSAVTTEIESVEKVINENIEGTFNAFG